MALIDKLKAIGDAIRAKTGGTEELTLDQMATEIAGIEGGGDGNLKKVNTSTMADTEISVGKRFFKASDTIKTVKIYPCELVDQEAFRDCPNLETVELTGGATITTCLVIGESAFRNCEKLTSVNLERLQEIEPYAFYSDEKLEIAYLREHSDSSNIYRIGERAFAHCSSLRIITSLTSEDNDIFVSIIDKNAFDNCTSLVNLNIYACDEIYDYAFSQCTALEKVRVSVSDEKSPTKIDEWAFCDCTNLKTLILSNGQGVGNTPIVGDINITAIANTGIIAADGVPTGEGFVYVPAAAFDGYVTSFVTQIVTGFGQDEATATYIATAILRKIEDYPEICG